MRTVLVHGLAGSSRWWRPLEARLEGLDLDPVDLPRRASLEDLEEWVAARLEPRAALVGHSLGGLLAARVAARRPQLVDRLVLIAPAGLGPRPLLAHSVPLARTLLRVRPRHAPLVLHDALRAGPRALWTGARAAVQSDLQAELARVRVPTLVVWGDRDRLLPPPAALPGARLELVRGAGHVPMLERPEEVSRLLREFLAGS